MRGTTLLRPPMALPQWGLNSEVLLYVKVSFGTDLDRLNSTVTYTFAIAAVYKTQM